MNIFKWFKKEPAKEPARKWELGSNADACIVYYVKKDGETCVDIEIDNYEDSTMDNFFNLVSTIGRDEIFVETLEIIRQGFLESDRKDLFLQLTAHLSLEFIQNSDGEEPCLNPSDVL